MKQENNEGDTLMTLFNKVTLCLALICTMLSLTHTPNITYPTPENLLIRRIDLGATILSHGLNLVVIWVTWATAYIMSQPDKKNKENKKDKE